MSGDPLEDIDFDPDLGGKSGARIRVRAAGLEVEVEGGEGEDLEDVYGKFDVVLNDTLTEIDEASQALRDRLLSMYN